MPESIPAFAIISFEEHILEPWAEVQEIGFVNVDTVVCTLEQRDSISEAFGFEDLTPISEDLYYTRITSVATTPEYPPEAHENPVCSAQWESNEHDDGDLTVLYYWMMANGTDANMNNPDSFWYSNFSENGTFDRNNTDSRINPSTGEPWTNIHIGNQSISGKEIQCFAFLVSSDLSTAIIDLEWDGGYEGVFHWSYSDPLVFQIEDGCEGILDCAGVCNGDSTLDECGVCDGDGSTCATCGNITYTGCCSTDEDGNYTIVTWCENEQISTIDCWYSGEGCGWRDADGFYGCVDASYAGTEDPSGEHPCDCSELESEES